MKKLLWLLAVPWIAYGQPYFVHYQEDHRSTCPDARMVLDTTNVLAAVDTLPHYDTLRYTVRGDTICYRLYTITIGIADACTFQLYGALCTNDTITDTIIHTSSGGIWADSTNWQEVLRVTILGAAADSSDSVCVHAYASDVGLGGNPNTGDSLSKYEWINARAICGPVDTADFAYSVPCSAVSECSVAHSIYSDTSKVVSDQVGWAGNCVNAYLDSIIGCSVIRIISDSLAVEAESLFTALSRHIVFGDVSSNVATGTFAWVAGDNDTASGDYSGGWGINNVFSGDYTGGWGIYNTISANQSGGWGNGNTISGLATGGWGYNNTISGQHSGGWGYENTISGQRSGGWGIQNTISGYYSGGWGYGNTISGYYSGGWNQDIIVQARWATALGYKAEVLGSSSDTGSACIGTGVVDSVPYCILIGDEVSDTSRKPHCFHVALDSSVLPKTRIEELVVDSPFVADSAEYADSAGYADTAGYAPSNGPDTINQVWADFPRWDLTQAIMSTQYNTTICETYYRVIGNYTITGTRGQWQIPLDVISVDSAKIRYRASGFGAAANWRITRICVTQDSAWGLASTTWAETTLTSLSNFNAGDVFSWEAQFTANSSGDTVEIGRVKIFYREED